MAKKKSVAKPEITAEQAARTRASGEGELARTNRQSRDDNPYQVGDELHEVWHDGWDECVRAEIQTLSLLYEMQEIGVTTELADLESLNHGEAFALLDWIDHAPVDEHDGDATSAWRAALPSPMRLTERVIPADEFRPECRVIEYSSLPPLQVIPPRDEFEAELRELMLAFDNQGVAIDETQWREISEAGQAVATRWVNGRRTGVLSPVPDFLLPFASEKLKAEYAPYFEAQAELRKVLMPVKFGKPSVSKPDEEQTIKITLAVPIEHLGPGTADDLFRHKRCRIAFSRRTVNEWDQAELPGVQSLNRIISTEADVSGYSVTRHDRKFAFLVDESLLSIPDAFALWECRGSCRVEVIGEPVSKKKGGDEDNGTSHPRAEARAAAKPAPTLPMGDAADSVERDHATYTIAKTDDHIVEITTATTSDGKWRTYYEGTSPWGWETDEDLEDDQAPRVSEAAALEARIGQLVDHWQQWTGQTEGKSEFDDERAQAKQIVTGLKGWLAELGKGTELGKIEALHGAVEQESK